MFQRRDAVRCFGGRQSRIGSSDVISAGRPGEEVSVLGQ